MTPELDGFRRRLEGHLRELERRIDAVPWDETTWTAYEEARLIALALKGLPR